MVNCLTVLSRSITSPNERGNWWIRKDYDELTCRRWACHRIGTRRWNSKADICWTSSRFEWASSMREIRASGSFTESECEWNSATCASNLDSKFLNSSCILNFVLSRRRESLSTSLKSIRVSRLCNSLTIASAPSARSTAESGTFIYKFWARTNSCDCRIIPCSSS